MAKKMISIKMNPDAIGLLKTIAANENLSQGQKVEQLVKKEAKRLNIEIPAKNTTFKS